MSFINNDLFQTVYTDPSGQDWKLQFSSLVPIYTGAPLGAGASPLAAQDGYVVRWTWSNENDPATGGNQPGTTHVQLDPANVPFLSFQDAEMYTLGSDFLANTLVDHSTVEILEATDPSIPQNWYYYNLDMAHPGVTMRWESNADDPNKAIMGSSADLTVYVDDVQEEIFTRAIVDSELNLCLSIYKREETGEFRDWWHGIALPEALSMEIRDHRRVLDLSFTCGLALLNDIDWKNDDGSKKSGQLSLKGALLESLQRLPHFSNFTFRGDQDEQLPVAANSTATPNAAVGLTRLVPTYTGPLAFLAKDPALAEVAFVTATTDLTEYSGWKCYALLDQVTGATGFVQFSFGNMPTVDGERRALLFDGENTSMQSVATSLRFTGTDKRQVFISAESQSYSSGTLLAQGDRANNLTGTDGKVMELSTRSNQFEASTFKGVSKWDTARGGSFQNQVLTFLCDTDSGTASDWYLRRNSGIMRKTSETGSGPMNTEDANVFIGGRSSGTTIYDHYEGYVHGLVSYKGTLPTDAEARLIEADMINMYQNGHGTKLAGDGAYALSTYGTPMPVTETNDWDPSVKDPLSHMYCLAETFNEPKQEYDRKFEMRPDPSFISTGHVLEDICKALGMTLTQWEGGWHLFSRPYLFKTTGSYLSYGVDNVDADELAPKRRRWVYEEANGLVENIYEDVDVTLEFEDFAAPKDGMVKTYAIPFRGVQMTHERAPSDIIYGVYTNPDSESFGQTTHHKLAPDHPGSPLNSSPFDDTRRYGDARLGYKGNKDINRRRRKGTMWTMAGAYYQDGHDFDANGGSQGTNLDPRAQHKRLEDGTTGGGPNQSFYDGRYLGPDSTTVEDLDLEAGETLSLEFGAYVENGRLDEHIGQTYIFHNRVEIVHQNGDKYRLRRHVITQDTWTSTGTKRATKIDGSNGDVDKGWPGDKDYFIKEYNSLAWVKESDVSADEWEDCWYELMSFEPSTTATEGDQLADVTLTALPYYGDAPMGTVYNDEDGVLDVEKENRFAYIQADLAVELPGVEGVDEFNSLYTECGVSCWSAGSGPRSVGSFAGETPLFASRKADGSARRRPDGAAYVSPEGKTTDMPYTMGVNKWVIRYGGQGEKNDIQSYADGGAGVRMYNAGSSRLGSRFVFMQPDYKGRIKVEHMNSDGTFTDKTFNTQWRPGHKASDSTHFNNSIHDQVAYETLDILGYVRPRYEGSWVKHVHTTQGGCPAPFLPAITRNLDPDAGVGVVPYRLRWTFAKGFQMEGVEIGDAYEKDRIAYVLGETGTGVNGGGSSNAIKGVTGVAQQGNAASYRPQFYIKGSNDSSNGGPTSRFGPFNHATGVNDGTGVYFVNLDGTDSTLMDGTTGYVRRFNQVVDADSIALYGMGNLGRLVVDEPGIYMAELKGRLTETHAASNQATYGFGFHVLGSVSNNVYTGDTVPKVSNMVEVLATHSRAGSTSADPYLTGTFTAQVELQRGDVVTWSAWHDNSPTQWSIFTDPEKLKARIIKLSEPAG